jgi:hypothetical protein
MLQVEYTPFDPPEVRDYTLKCAIRGGGSAAYVAR